MQCWLYNNCNHKDCDKFCLRRHKLEGLYAKSLLSDAQKQFMTLYIDEDGTDKAEFNQLRAIEQDIENFVAEGKNLYLHSRQCGNGKTSWAIRLIQDYFNKIWPKSDLTCRALFINVPRFLLALKDNITTKSEYVDFIKKNIAEADLVVWDDIAAKVGTEFELNHLLSLIDTRISLGKSNIYTSNLQPNEMGLAIGERLASRVCYYSIDIEFHGTDKRNLRGDK